MAGNDFNSGFIVCRKGRLLFQAFPCQRAGDKLFKLDLSPCGELVLSCSYGRGEEFEKLASFEVGASVYIVTPASECRELATCYKEFGPRDQFGEDLIANCICNLKSAVQ